jgi:pimeloyl-ACP methyl ester carboxylesterase
MQIDRAFVRIAEGLVHYRHCGGGRPLPLYMIHASPMSAIAFEPMMGALGVSRRVIAPDTLGYGDSAPPAPETPDIAYFADSVARILDALNLGRIDVYGSHTGAHIACELALRHPGRARRIVFDGIGMFSAEDKAEFLEKYAPPLHAEPDGSHFAAAWTWSRDGMLFFPNFRRTPTAARDAAVPPAAALHLMTLELLKALGTYHKGYHAAFRHPDRARLPLIEQPVFCMASEDDILKDRVPIAASLLKHGTSALLPSEGTAAGLAAKAAAVAAFLDAP